MSAAITISFLPATNTKPARWKASANGLPTIIRSQHYDDNSDFGKSNGPRRLAQDFADKYGWKGRLVEGTLDNGDSVFVIVPPENPKRFAYIDAARAIYQNDDTEIDDNARISENDDGAWVQAWVYVNEEELESYNAEVAAGAERITDQ